MTVQNRGLSLLHMLEETIRSLADDQFEADGQGRLNGTQKTSREVN